MPDILIGDGCGTGGAGVIIGGGGVRGGPINVGDARGGAGAVILDPAYAIRNRAIIVIKPYPIYLNFNLAASGIYYYVFRNRNISNAAKIGHVTYSPYTY